MRQRPISSVPDWTLQTAPTTFFRSALTRLLQTTSSILPDEIAAPTAGSPSRVRTKPNQLRVWGTRPLRTVGDRRKARPHGADARDYAAVFRVFKVPVGRILLSHVCFCFAPRTTQNLLGYPMIPPPQFPVFS